MSSTKDIENIENIENAGRLTLLVDMGWMTMRYFSVLLKDFDTSLHEEIREEASEQLASMISKSITSCLCQFDCVDNIILCSEGGSWRKDWPRPKVLEGIEYKGNRVHPIKFDWDRVWKASSRICKGAEELGITVSVTKGAEGDDWMWYWSGLLRSKGTSSIIWSSDNDLKALCSQDPMTGAWTAWYNDKAGLWLPQSLDSGNIPLIDLFMGGAAVLEDPVLERVRSRVRTVRFFNPDDIAVDKVIWGDQGDNIPPVAVRSKGGRNYRIPKGQWKAIRESLGINSMESLSQKKEEASKAIEGLGGFGNSHDILECLDYNTRMVWLSDRTIPKGIINRMKECKLRQAPVRDLRVNSELLMGPGDDGPDIPEDLIASEEEIGNLEIGGLAF